MMASTPRAVLLLVSLAFVLLLEISRVTCEDEITGEYDAGSNSIAQADLSPDEQEAYARLLAQMYENEATATAAHDDEEDEEYEPTSDGFGTNSVDKRFSEFLGGKKRFSEFLGGKKRFSEFLGGKKRFSEFLGGKRKRFSEFLGGKKRFSEFLGGKKRFSEFLGGKKRFSEFLGGKRSVRSIDGQGAVGFGL